MKKRRLFSASCLTCWQHCDPTGSSGGGGGVDSLAGRAAHTHTHTQARRDQVHANRVGMD